MKHENDVTYTFLSDSLQRQDLTLELHRTGRRIRNAVRLTRMQILSFSNTKNMKSDFILVFRLSDWSGIDCTSTDRPPDYLIKKALGSNIFIYIWKLDMSGLPMEKHGAQARLFWMSWLTVSLSFSYLRMRKHHALNYGNRVRYNWTLTSGNYPKKSLIWIASQITHSNSFKTS